MKIVSVKPGKLPLKHFLDQEVTLLSFPPHGHAEMSGLELGKCTTHLVAWLTSPSSAPQLPRNSRWTTKIYPLDAPRGTFDLQEDLKEFWRIRGEKHLPWNLYRIVIEPAMESGKTPHLHKSGTSCSYCKCTVLGYIMAVMDWSYTCFSMSPRDHRSQQCVFNSHLRPHLRRMLSISNRKQATS